MQHFFFRECVRNGMLDYFIKQLLRNVTDWTIVFLFVCFILWFALTQPIFFSDTKNSIPKAEVNNNELALHVRVLTHSFTPRTKAYDFLGATAEYIYKKFAKQGYTRYQNIQTLAGNYKNVILELGPNTNESIVIGAHYDAETDALNAEGNASGVSSLLELARVLSKQQDKLRVKVVLVAYPLSQEQHAYQSGSYFHADSMKKTNQTVRLMVSLDSVGQFTTDDNSQKYPFKFMQFIYPTRGNFINLSARLQDYSMLRKLKKSFESVTATSISSQSLPESFDYVDSNDHKNYWRHGFPAILISDTKNYRKQSKKLPITSTLDYTKMADLVRGLYQLTMDTKPLKSSRTQLAQEQLSMPESKAVLD